MRVPSARAIENGTENGTIADIFPAGLGAEALAVILKAFGVAVVNE